MGNVFWMVLLPLLLHTACASSSSLTLPSCADRLEVEGQHERRGRTITFDHRLDVPMSRTEITLKNQQHSETINLWNDQPNGTSFMLGLVAGVGGSVLWASAWHQVAENGRSITDEQPFYLTVLGTGAVSIAGLLVLTGWHPRSPPNLEEMCRPTVNKE